MSTEYTISNAIYTSGTFCDSADGTSLVGYWDTNDHYTVQPWITVWPQYYYHWCGEGYRVSKIETAFKIVQKLMDLKITAPKTVKQFVELVNEIGKVL